MIVEAVVGQRQREVVVEASPKAAAAVEAAIGTGERSLGTMIRWIGIEAMVTLTMVFGAHMLGGPPSLIEGHSKHRGTGLIMSTRDWTILKNDQSSGLILLPIDYRHHSKSLKRVCNRNGLHPLLALSLIVLHRTWKFLSITFNHLAAFTIFRNSGC